MHVPLERAHAREHAAVELEERGEAQGLLDRIAEMNPVVVKRPELVEDLRRTGRDRTEQMILAANIRRLNGELEQRVIAAALRG